mmetsp:Transcript_14375/g.20184  ORF Transcript_14375/g.20184 Transcript_14375/m.20184 type:complete len:92 (-) Transcript_14375:107-382(-)
MSIHSPPLTLDNFMFLDLLQQFCIILNNLYPRDSSTYFFLREPKHPFEQRSLCYLFRKLFSGEIPSSCQCEDWFCNEKKAVWSCPKVARLK